MIDARGETPRADAIEQVDRRHVQRQAQGLRGTDRAVEGFAEVARPVVAEALRRIDQQAFGMDHAVVDRHAVEEGLERRAGRTPRAHHVDMAESRLVAESHRTHIGARFHRRVVDHQQRCRRAFRQVREIRGNALLQRALQVRIDRRRDARLLRMRAAQALRKQRSDHRRLQLPRDHRLDACVFYRLARPYAEVGHAIQHLVARSLRGFRMTIRTTTARRLRQHRQQCRLRTRQLRRRLAEIGPARGFHAFDGAAERCALEIEDQDLALVQVRFELQRAQDLHQLAPGRARRTRTLAVENARNLHGQRRAARHRAPAARHLPGRTQQRDGIDAGMPPEPAVLVVQQRLEVERRHRLRRRRVAPHALGIGERAQRRAIARDDQRAGITRLRQLWWKDQVEQKQGRQQCCRAPAQPGQASRQKSSEPHATRRGALPRLRERAFRIIVHGEISCATVTSAAPP